jgi:hydrogenase small subunit
MQAGITRREALKRIYAAIVATGASAFLSFDDLLAADRGRDGKPNVIWLHGTSCSGCSVSFLNIEQVPVVDLITRFANLIFHPDLSLATGHQALQIHERLLEPGPPFVLVVEGGIPARMPHACMMGDRPITDWVEQLAHHAAACIAAGTCAAAGGVPKMKGTLTGSQTLGEFLQAKGIPRPLVNLPNCPMKPEHLVYTLLHFAHQGALPELDARSRPKRFFARTVHEQCVHYAAFQEERFAEFIGDDGCLLKLGCQGPVTWNDCPVLGHNGNTNTCIRAGHPCVGCASTNFPRQIMLHSYRDTRPLDGMPDDPRQV